MSNFTDDEDRQLVQLAASFTAYGGPISWGQLAARIPRSSHSKEELQQRLKTLKRTHGRDLRKFPQWFFRASLMGVTRRRRRRKVTETSPKRLLPPLELVCRSNAAYLHHLCEENTSWSPPCIPFPVHTSHATSEAAPIKQLTLQIREVPSDNTHHQCRENGSGLASLELLAEVAAHGSDIFDVIC